MQGDDFLFQCKGNGGGSRTLLMIKKGGVAKYFGFKEKNMVHKYTFTCLFDLKILFNLCLHGLFDDIDGRACYD